MDGKQIKELLSYIKSIDISLGRIAKVMESNQNVGIQEPGAYSHYSHTDLNWEPLTRGELMKGKT